MDNDITLDEQLDQMFNDEESEVSTETVAPTVEPTEAEETTPPVKEELDPASEDVDGDNQDNQADPSGEQENPSTEPVLKYKHKNKVPASRRINQLTAKNRQAERTLEEYKARIEALESNIKPEVPKEKVLEDFDSVSAYQKHLAKEAVTEQLASTQVMQKANSDELSIDTEVDAELMNLYATNTESAKKVYDDFEEVMQGFDNTIPIPQKIKNYLLGSKAGAMAMYNLTANADVVQAIEQARLIQNPRQQSKAVTDIVVQVHDEIFNNFDSYCNTATKQTNTVAPVAGFTPPKALVAVDGNPPKQKQTSTNKKDFMDLEGDEFFEGWRDDKW